MNRRIKCFIYSPKGVQIYNVTPESSINDLFNIYTAKLGEVYKITLVL